MSKINKILIGSNNKGKFKEIADLLPSEFIAQSDENGVTDEFLEPVRVKPSFISDGDGVIMFNFRPDRDRQLIKSITK